MNHANTGASRKKLFKMILVLIVLLLALAVWHQRSEGGPQDTSLPSEHSTSKAANFNKSAHSTISPESIWVIVNKQHALQPKTYTPQLTVPDVRLKGSSRAENMHVSTQMSRALESLFQSAHASNHDLMLSSGYRSYAYQVGVYNGIVRSKGQTQADAESARPGYSEHQTGLAADVAPASGRCDLSQCFGSTPEGIWLAANAYRYGFIVRYPADKVAVTGYEYEPWHIRYVGTELATQMHRRNIETLEEFFNISGGTSYN